MLQTIFSWAVVALVGAQASADRPLVFSTMPFDDADSQRAVFSVLSKHLGERLGKKVHFEAGSSYDDVVQGLTDGRVDLALIGAAAYVSARRSGQVRAILRAVRHRTSTYRGVILVKADSGITDLSQLKGKTFAYVDKKSTAGYFYPRATLRRAGLEPDRDLEVVFAGGHHTVVRKVAEGEVEAGACFDGAEGTLKTPEVVRVLARTEAIPGDPVVVRAGLGKDLVTALRSALIELSMVPEAKTFFTFAEIDGFVPAFDGDYDEVASMIRDATSN